jgi:hypothetical protein
VNPLLLLASLSLATGFAPAGEEPDSNDFACAGEIWLSEAECAFIYGQPDFQDATVRFHLSCIEGVGTPCYVGAYGATLTDGIITFWVTCGFPPVVHSCGFGFAPGAGERLDHWEARCWFEGTGTYGCSWEFE